MDKKTKTVDDIYDKAIEMVNFAYKKEPEEHKTHAAMQKLKFDYYAMMQTKVNNNTITQELVDCINKECSQYNLYGYLMPKDKDLNTEFHYLVYAQNPKIDKFKPLCPFIFAYFPNKYGCTANSIIAINKKGLCYNLHEKNLQ